MRANSVVLFQPELYDTPCFRHGIEQPSIQTAVPEHRIETFIGPVLPGNARVNVMGARLLCSQLVLQGPGNQFRALSLLIQAGTPYSRNKPVSTCVVAAGRMGGESQAYLSLVLAKPVDSFSMIFN